MPAINDLGTEDISFAAYVKLFSIKADWATPHAAIIKVNTAATPSVQPDKHKRQSTLAFVVGPTQPAFASIESIKIASTSDGTRRLGLQLETVINFQDYSILLVVPLAELPSIKDRAAKSIACSNALVAAIKTRHAAAKEELAISKSQLIEFRKLACH
ncbi:hypothetical protein DL89DRAFT_264749 [Linderina pennispora]|uniref:Uncharacterized protein n=1 Tax=Linderina pennispora TaxID=61395 RepID=A0A1Y1WN31_9FUNG|nr:uncharacterized protein DL89DRAFT_264749 [Linderina pennispora]ORX74961.1 hypothetical protein DL89DRAFT_264749 [Linderina pennispora]